MATIRQLPIYSGKTEWKAYLLLDVVQRIGRVNSKADQDDVGVRIGQRTQTVIIFLTSRIPQGQLDMFAINLDIGDIVLENGGDIDLRGFEESVRSSDKYSQR